MWNHFLKSDLLKLATNYFHKNIINIILHPNMVLYRKTVTSHGPGEGDRKINLKRNVKNK